MGEKIRAARPKSAKQGENKGPVKSGGGFKTGWDRARTTVWGGEKKKTGGGKGGPVTHGRYLQCEIIKKSWETMCCFRVFGGALPAQ